jgi:hypothetical protein
MWGDSHDKEDYAEIFTDSAILEYPDPGNLSFSIPEAIRHIYDEAKRIKLSSPNAFAVQIGRALEALCKDRGAVGRNLHQQINKLVSRGELPATLGDAVVLLKDLRNVGAHNDEKSVNLSQADAIDKFFRAVIEYIYVAPQTLKALKDSLSRSE